MYRHVILGAALVLAAPSSKAASAEEDLIRFAADFRHAIATHDGKGLSGMFIDPAGAWFSVEGPSRRLRPDSHRTFADFVGKSTRPLDEPMDDLRVSTDGEVGTVAFRYVFLVDGKPTNHGMETWQVVHTPGGWRIASMLYSVLPGGAP